MKNTIYQNLKYKRGDKGLLKVMLKAKSEGKLTDEQIKTIIERTDLTARDLKVIDDPFEFEETSRDLDYTFHHSWAGDIRRTVATTKLVGDYNVGHDDIYEYSFNGQPVEEEQDEEIGNFSVNDVIVVKVKEGEYKDFDIMSSDDYEETSSEYILMYVPKEKYTVKSFEELRRQKDLLEKIEEAQEESKALDEKLNEKDIQTQDN